MAEQGPTAKGGSVLHGELPERPASSAARPPMPLLPTLQSFTPSLRRGNGSSQAEGGGAKTGTDICRGAVKVLREDGCLCVPGTPTVRYT